MILNKGQYQNHIHETKKRLNEIKIQLEKMDAEYENFLNNFGPFLPSSEDLKNEENFTPQEWEELQKEKSQLEDLLNLELSQLKNPEETEKTRKEQGEISPHWLYIR